MFIYAARDPQTGKLVSDILSKHKKFWQRKADLQQAINSATNGRYRKYNSLELVTFQLVEVKDDAE